LARNDCFWKLLVQLGWAFYFLQPLYWILARRIEESAEEVCDNYVLVHGGDRHAYAQQLVDFSEQLYVSPRDARVGIGMVAFRTLLGRRVVRLLDPERSLALRASRPLVSGLACASLIAASFAAAFVVGPVTDMPAAHARADKDSPRLIAGTAKVEWPAALSPDRQKLAYVDWEGQDGDLVVRDLATGKEKKITQANPDVDIYEFCPDVFAWSHDSQWIAYMWFYGLKANEQLRAVNVEDGRIVVLREVSSPRYYPEDWTPDNKTVLCRESHGDERVGLVTIALNGGAITPLMMVDETEPLHARFSPDGGYVAYELSAGSETNAQRNVYVLDLGKGQTNQVTFSGSAGSPVWTQDGNTVLFASDRRGGWDLWGVRVQDGLPTPPPFLVLYGIGDHPLRMADNDLLLVHRPIEAADGYTIVQSQADGGKTEDLETLEGFLYFEAAGGVYHMNPGGTERVPLPQIIRGEPSLGAHGQFRWFLDRRELKEANSTNAPLRVELFAVRDDGQAVEQLTDDPDWIASDWRRWAVDAANGAVDGRISWTVLARPTEGTPERYQIRTATVRFVDGGKRMELSSRPEILLEALVTAQDCSPDGQFLVYTEASTVGDRRENTLRIRHLSSGKTQVLAEGQGPRWSPDGSRVAYTHSRGVWIIRPDGTDPVEIIVDPNPRGRVIRYESFRRPIWSPDSGYLVCDHTKSGTLRLDMFLLAADGSEQRVLAPDLENARALAWREEP
jgi:Tol biopolymer transport system component